MVLVSCLGDTERLGADRGQPRVSPQQILPEQGRRPARPLTGPGAGSRRRARKEGGRYRAHRAQSRVAGRACGGCQKKASILPGLGRRLGLCHYYVAGLPTERSWQEAEARLRPQGLPGRVSPSTARGRGSPGRRPRIPTPPRQPIRVVSGHELRPQGSRGEEDAALLGSSSAAPAIREIKVCSLQLVCSASHIRRATSCSSRAQGRKGQIKN
jgi:hypothetical protein